MNKKRNNSKLYIKIKRSMQIATLLILAGIVHLSASTYAEEHRISVQIKNGTFYEVITQIEQQSEFMFFYKSEEIDNNLRVTLEAKNKLVFDILNELLKNRGLHYQIIDRHILISKAPIINQEGKRITGTVIDVNGEPIIGANVVEKGTTNGRVTDIDGKFEFSVSPGATLEISYIGYMSKEVTVGNNSLFSVTLEEDLKTLDEVVVVGYGTQKKAHLIGSVSTVKAEEIEKISTSRLSNALAGRLAGVTVAQTGGARPGNGSEITIRARGTWNSTGPLYVIDGIVRDGRALDDLDPSQVESFSVLKDAAAATIYGSRAANGVILVTTKKGKEGKPTISYSGAYSIGSFTVMPERETMEQRFQMVNDHQMEFGGSFYKDNMKPSIYKNLQNSSGGYINNDVFTDDEMDYYRKRGAVDLLKDTWNEPVTTNHSINVSGGTDKVRYFVGGAYNDEDGAFKSLNYRKYNIRGSVEAKLNKYWTASLDLNTTNTKELGPMMPSGGGAYNAERKLKQIFAGLSRTNLFIPAKVDGKYIGSGGNMTGDNILAIAEGANGTTEDTYWSTEYTAGLKWDVPWVKGLSAKTTYNKFWRQRFYKTWNTPYEVYSLRKEGTNGHIVTNDIVGVSGIKGGEKGMATLYELSGRDESYQFNAMLTYNNTFGKHEVGALLGYEQVEAYADNFSAQKRYYTIDQPYFNFGPGDTDDAGNAGNNYSIGNAQSESARLSYIGRMNYAYDGRYLAEFSFRRDASVKFHNEFRWGFFPSGSLAWRVSEEAFIRDNLTWLSNLKLRGSVGLTGNDEVDAWQWQDKMNLAGGFYYGGSSSTLGMNVSSLANSAITWEKSLSYNAGLEAGFLQNMFTFGLDYFFRHTYDILGSHAIDIPDTFGATLAASNYGIVDSYGIEVEVGYNKQINKDWAILAKGNFGWSDNKLVEWDETGVPQHLSVLGKNWDRRRGYLTDGVIHRMVDNGDGTYNVTTSTGNTYKVPEKGYYLHGNGSDNDIVADHFLAMRPGVLFYKDIGSPAGVDADGNALYSSTPDGAVTNDNADRTWIMDHYNPPFNYGLLLGSRWKGFSLEVFFNGLAGHQTYLGWDGIGGDGLWDDTSVAYWSKDHYSSVTNPDGMMPAPTNWWGLNVRGYDTNVAENNPDFWVRNASFLRLKNVTLSYDLPKNVLATIGVSAIRVYASGNNVALLYNPLKGIADPELAGSVNNMYKTGDGIGTRPENPAMSYPLMRTWTFGLNVSF
ncbi:MAG: TonB-dependent receptor [Tannerella sp.]|jgi:TonB-linked SusC/RagA family outer membrane protein|nr:TonB-dependent receptor [Tannerella sp.]